MNMAHFSFNSHDEAFSIVPDEVSSTIARFRIVNNALPGDLFPRLLEIYGLINKLCLCHLIAKKESYVSNV